MSNSNYIKGITPLRGLAALLVTALHYQMFIAPIGKTSKFYLMVDLFFVLSGFIMYHVYGKMFGGGIQKQSYFKFMKARFARIYPLHFFTLLLTIGIYLIYVFADITPGAYLQQLYDTFAILSNLVLTQGMGTHQEGTWNAPSWSISVEWWVYIFFPFLAYFLLNTSRWSRIALSLFAMGGYLLLTYYLQPLHVTARAEHLGVPLNESNFYTIDVGTGVGAFLRCLCGFIAGMMVFEGYQKSWGRTWLKNGFVFIGLWIALFGLLIANALPHFLSIVFFGLMILSAAYGEGWVSRQLNNKPFRLLGDISYSIYLTHLPIMLLYIALRNVMIPNDPKAKYMGFAFTTKEAWMGFAVFLVVTVIVSYFTYKYIETPARLFLSKKKHKEVLNDKATLPKVV